MCIMMARLRPMTFSPTGMPACLRASSRQSNAARSCAKHDPERNVLGCSQTLKNDTLTHPSLWADHSKKTLLLFALAHQFLQQIIEGDELYTSVHKKVAPNESQGWTVVWMDRATRLLWDRHCGRKDRTMRS